MMPCANVLSKHWYRCGCTDNTPWRLGDAGSMTLLPWFVPRTESPVQLREVGLDRGHLLTESCSDVHLHVCRCRTGMTTAAAVAWEAAAQISLLVPALSLLDRKRVLQQRVWQQHRVLQQHEEVVAHMKPSVRVVGGAIIV